MRVPATVASWRGSGGYDLTPMATRRRPSSRGRRQAPLPRNTNTQQSLIVFGGVGGLLLVIILMVVNSGSDKKKPVVDATANATKPAQPAKKEPEVPADVPAHFKTKVEQAWPAIESKGKDFEKYFKAAQDAKRADDRVKFVEETDKAAKAFQQLQDGWAAVYYSADELPQDVQEVCRRWMGTYDKKVRKWLKKAKALKELSIATAGN